MAKSAERSGLYPVGHVTNSVVTVGGTTASSSAYQYDAAERLHSISTASANSTSSTFLYTYNPTNGAVASISNTVSGITTTYAYDLLDRATNITYSSANGSLISALDYAYDAAGMITNKTIVGSGIAGLCDHLRI